MNRFLQPARDHILDRLADSALWLVAMLHVLAAALFFSVLLSLSPANAAEEPACGGENLLARMQASDPKAYDKLIAEAKATPNGEGIF